MELVLLIWLERISFSQLFISTPVLFGVVTKQEQPFGNLLKNFSVSRFNPSISHLQISDGWEIGRILLPPAEKRIQHEPDLSLHPEYNEQVSEENS